MASSSVLSSTDWPLLSAANKNTSSSSVKPSAGKKSAANKNTSSSSVKPSANWADLHPELTSDILLRLGAIEILENAQKVCRSWRNVCKDPSMWRKIDMHNLGNLRSIWYDLKIMCSHAVDRSEGGLTEIALWYFATDSLLNYIADRSSNLRSLRLVMCYPVTDEGFAKAILKLPLLEDLELSYCKLSHESLKVLGQSCPNLKTLKLNYDGDGDGDDGWGGWGYGEACDDEALAIAETMPRLRHLQLIGNKLTNTGLIAILDKCPNLEYLDFRQCSHINLVGELEKRCYERIRVVKQPNDFPTGYPFDANVRDRDNYEDDQFSDYSDADDDTDTDMDIPQNYNYRNDIEYCYIDQYYEFYDFIVE